MKFPLLIINFKAYKEGTEKIAEIVRQISKDGASIVVCPPHLFLKDTAKIHQSFAQSIDPFAEGAHTGAVTAEQVKSAGAVGSLINHSEKRLPVEEIRKCVDQCKSFGLLSCVCAATESEAALIAEMGPDMILIEPPELVGGNISVSTARPEIVSNSVSIVKNINPNIKVLCGAGVKNSNDARKSIELGADGVGVSSGIVKAADVEKAIKDIISGLI